MAISDKPWGQFSAADYADAGAYCSAALVNENTGSRSTWTKAECHLPVKEPGGDLNRNGVHAAAARLAGAGGGVGISPAAKRSAARKLVSLYSEIGDPVPDSISALAR